MALKYFTQCFSEISSAVLRDSLMFLLQDPLHSLEEKPRSQERETWLQFADLQNVWLESLSFEQMHQKQTEQTFYFQQPQGALVSCCHIVFQELVIFLFLHQILPSDHKHILDAAQSQTHQRPIKKRKKGKEKQKHISLKMGSFLWSRNAHQ